MKKLLSLLALTPLVVASCGESTAATTYYATTWTNDGHLTYAEVGVNKAGNITSVTLDETFAKVEAFEKGAVPEMLEKGRGPNGSLFISNSYKTNDGQLTLKGEFSQENINANTFKESSGRFIDITVGDDEQICIGWAPADTAKKNAMLQVARDRAEGNISEADYYHNVTQINLQIWMVPIILSGPVGTWDAAGYDQSKPKDPSKSYCMDERIDLLETPTGEIFGGGLPAKGEPDIEFIPAVDPKDASALNHLGFKNYFLGLEAGNIQLLDPGEIFRSPEFVPKSVGASEFNDTNPVFTSFLGLSDPSRELMLMVDDKLTKAGDLTYVELRDEINASHVAGASTVAASLANYTWGVTGDPYFMLSRQGDSPMDSNAKWHTISDFAYEKDHIRSVNVPNSRRALSESLYSNSWGYEDTIGIRETIGTRVSYLDTKGEYETQEQAIYAGELDQIWGGYGKWLRSSTVENRWYVAGDGWQRYIDDFDNMFKGIPAALMQVPYEATGLPVSADLFQNAHPSGGLTLSDLDNKYGITHPIAMKNGLGLEASKKGEAYDGSTYNPVDYAQAILNALQSGQTK